MEVSDYTVSVKNFKDFTWINAMLRTYLFPKFHAD